MFAVATLAFLSYKQTRDIAAIRKDVVGFAESVPKNGSLELQGKCAEQSRKFFQEAGYTPKDLAQYEDHYNPKLNKCFVLFERAPTLKRRRESFGRIEICTTHSREKTFGQYAWHTEKDKKYWEVKPVTCYALSETGDKKNCESDEAFSELIKVYMGN